VKSWCTPPLTPSHPHTPHRQVAAAGAVCNLALDFSNVCPALVEAGLPHALSSLLTSMLPELRLKALWAFKNLAFGCEPNLQQQLLKELSWPTFRELLTGDDEPRVRVQAVGLLQNLCKGGGSIEQVRGLQQGAPGGVCTVVGRAKGQLRIRNTLDSYETPWLLWVVLPA